MDLEIITIPATRGVQSGMEYYVAMLPLRSAGQLFQVDYFNLPPEERSQRIPDKKRVETISKWITDNPTNYLLPALTGSIEGEMVFEPWPDYPKVGILKISAGATLHLLDGQHRNESLRQAVRKKPELASEAIAVVLFQDKGLKWRQEAFALVNLTGKPPAKSLGQFYAGTPEAVFTREIVELIPSLYQYTEKDKNSLGGKENTKLLVYTWIHSANQQMRLGKYETQDKDMAYCKAFWEALLKYTQPWQKVFEGELTPNKVRDDYRCSHAVSIQALALIGKELNDLTPEQLIKKLAPLSKVDWHKSNPQFQGRIMNEEMKMLTKANNIRLLANYLKSVIGIELSADDAALEASMTISGK